MKKVYDKKLWNGVHLEEEENEEIPLNSWMQDVTTGMKKMELKTWNGSTEKNGEEEKKLEAQKDVQTWLLCT